MQTDITTRRVERERWSHTVKDVLAANRRLRARFSHIDCYPSKRRLYGVIQQHARQLSRKIILDYGCGTGGNVIDYLTAGAAKVYGMDISENYIALCKEACLRKGFSPDRYDLRVMDAHHLQYPDNTFDSIIGQGILHHLDVKVALNSLHRVLKPGGRMLFAEPLVDNPLLKLFRLLTPNARTRDERPFSRNDILELFAPAKWRHQNCYAGIIEAPVSMVTSFLTPSNADNVLLRASDKLERWINRRGILSSWNQVVLFDVTKK